MGLMKNLEVVGKPSSEAGLPVVKMYKYNFCPKVIMVKQGQTIRFINVDKRTSHSFWLKEMGRPESDRLFPEETLEVKIDMAPGVYPYLCGPHWESEEMRGSIKIE